jgi:bifunctional DNA-binding transcriptional regulator/antitoxin component of YhaV-PrlF toxin-antitoxin module
MSLELTVTAKGQVTLRQAVLNHLKVRPGDKIDVALLPDGRVEIKAVGGGHGIDRLYGILHRPGRRPVSLRAMQKAIETGHDD